jgi:hypothetical protein
MLRRVVLVRTDVSEGRSASFIRVTRIGELGTTLASASNRRTLFPRSVLRLLVAARVVFRSPILVTPKRRFLQEPHRVTSQKIPFFIVTTVKTSNLIKFNYFIRSLNHELSACNIVLQPLHYRVPHIYSETEKRRKE